MRTLILGTCYVSADKEGAQNYSSRIVELWAKLAIHLNPGVDILLVDSASPKSPGEFLKPLGFDYWLIDGPGPRPEQSPRMVVSFQDNLGHINTTGIDGWGRALSWGIECAIRRRYDYIAYMDADIICTFPVGPIIDKMARSGVKAACPMDPSYQFLENGLMFMEVNYLAESKFVERYDWVSRKFSADRMEIPERVFEELMEDVIFTLPIRGLRNDRDAVTVNNLAGASPYAKNGLDYITHCRDFELYNRLLEMNGIVL